MTDEEKALDLIHRSSDPEKAIEILLQLILEELTAQEKAS